MLFLAFWRPIKDTWGPQINICQFVCVVQIWLPTPVNLKKAWDQVESLMTTKLTKEANLFPTNNINDINIRNIDLYWFILIYRYILIFKILHRVGLCLCVCFCCLKFLLVILELPWPMKHVIFEISDIRNILIY